MFSSISDLKYTLSMKFFTEINGIYNGSTSTTMVLVFLIKNTMVIKIMVEMTMVFLVRQWSLWNI